MNYNDWFHEQHHYGTGNRDGKTSFNDTKWVDINKRLKTLIDTGSDLLNEQPFGVVGNKNGFDKLIDLLTRSNYTFEDVDQSLIDTYKVSLKNSMSRMIVNTHTVLFRCTNMDKHVVSMDKFTHYYIIDIPFNQLHFGDRDEFIRQKLHKMHNVASDNYVHMNEFISSEITSILGFTMLCTVNGFICNDCQVAIDDKGFKFKIGWLYSSDVEFIIYKLDESFVSKCVIDSMYIKHNTTIPYSVLKLDKNVMYGKRCMLNIYDPNFIKTVHSVPNFGTFTEQGLVINNLQQKTVNDVENNMSKNVHVVVYVFKYFHEIPNVYPAINYYDIMDTRRVFTDEHDNVTDVKENMIVSNSTSNINNLEICTPPIVLDRSVNMSFNTILSCINLHDRLMSFEKVFHTIGQELQKELDNGMFVTNVVTPINEMYDSLNKCYMDYLEGAILTSLVPDASIERFDELLTMLNRMRFSTVEQSQLYTIDEFFGDNFKAFVNTITSPFRNNALSNFTDLDKLSKNYFVDKNDERFNRPVSEQCLITLKYDRVNECWVFCLPDIKHFKGIGNTFYINENLEGDELFKFFVLYTDTDAPSEKEVSDLDLDTVFDFDMFCEEVDKHMGYIRYWYAENKLMKISKMMYNKYDDDTCVQVLSKILKQKIDADDILNIYPSNINYELSNITSDNVEEYDELSDRGPFSLNFMFYTLSMLYNNEDQMQSYFLYKLTNRLFNNRYSDICINQVIDKENVYPINYSKISISPNTIDTNKSVLSDESFSFYYGLPILPNDSTAYRYTFNMYDDELKHYMISPNGIDMTKYVMYEDPSQHGFISQSYHNDIHVGKLLTYYLTYVYDCISDLQTNYKKHYNQTSIIDSHIDTLKEHIKKLSPYTRDDNEFICPDTLSVVKSIVIDNPLISNLTSIRDKIKMTLSCTYTNRTMSIIEFVNKLISTLKHVYVTTGFDNHSMKRVRMLYIHLKKINTSMNIYEYKKWLNDIDLEMLKDLDNVLADNENFVLGNNVFMAYYISFSAYKNNTIPILDEIDVLIKDLSITLQDQHIKQITEYCDDVIKNYVFGMFILSDIKYDNSVVYNTQPYMLSITLPVDEHFKPPVGTSLNGDTITMIFHPTIDIDNNGSYHIKSISKICEYAFFAGNDIDNCIMKVMDNNGDTIKNINVSLSFEQISSSADISESFNQIINVNNTLIDFENIHESYDVNAEGLIVNKKHADMNYEMLIGNHFIQLEHVSELVLQPITYIQGSVDRVYIPNQKINDFINSDYGKHSSKQVFFKPSQVFHIPVSDDGSLTSVGGKYFVGQHLYLSTDDNLYTFPVVVTAVDHSINKGFIEVIVDNKKAKWFNVNDELISKYLTSNVRCHVVDDNIRNFLDEFNNPSYTSYNVPSINMDSINDVESLPGDPVFVQNNSPFVYSRLNWFFNDLVDNRFIDEEHKKHRFIYIGNSFINDNDDMITIKMVNHNFNTLTNPEMYPVLREEPNDHKIWDEEIKVFNGYKRTSETTINNIQMLIDRYKASLQTTTSEDMISKIMKEIESLQYDLEYEKEFCNRMDSYAEQLEVPTTWYNVRAYEDSLVYISNGRAVLSPSFIPNISDIPFSDKLEVFIYDWENKCWLSPSSYTIDINMVNAVKLHEYDEYTTYNVLHSITIKPSETFKPSKKLLIYLSYNKSDIFDEIPMNDYSCDVRFKPILSLDYINDDIKDPYSNIKIRKHFNGYESYVFDGYNKPDDFSIEESFYIKRPIRSGKYTYSPTIRLCDLTAINDEKSYDFSNFDMFVRIPFEDVSTKQTFKQLSYNVTINQPIDSFVPDQFIKLICIQNNGLSLYDGNISNIMFEGWTSYDDNNNQIITIKKSSFPSLTNDTTFVCTVFKDNTYKMSGGVISVDITCDENKLIDELNCWIKIPTDKSVYREIPNECIIVPKDSSLIDISKRVTLSFKNSYIRTSDDIVNIDNSSTFNPYEYYFDTKNETRLPVSNTRTNSFNERLVVDTDTNPDIKLIKSTYIGVCRYSLQNIPKNGFIDLTGYLPTPLSRDRYEFWVNGRCITNNEDLIILSPTSIQLCNLKSLSNFELIELVDDVDNNEIIKEGNVYIDLNGKIFASYKHALLSNRDIIKQDIRFSYNIQQHKPIHDYTSNLIPNPNNYDIEEDILNGITPVDVNDYNQLYNIPTLNGISIYHPTTSSLGINDIPSHDIIKLFDKVWKHETITNPLFMNTHRNGMSLMSNRLILHVKRDNDSFVIYTTGIVDKYFTLYISKEPNTSIDDVDNTIKIIPFVKIGTHVIIDKSYKNMWLHSTVENSKPVVIK